MSFIVYTGEVKDKINVDKTLINVCMTCHLAVLKRYEEYNNDCSVRIKIRHLTTCKICITDLDIFSSVLFCMLYCPLK